MPCFEPVITMAAEEEGDDDDETADLKVAMPLITPKRFTLKIV